MAWTQSAIKSLFYKARVVYRDTRMTIKNARNAELMGSLVVVVPKKIGSAPQRNLIKRRIRAIFLEKKLAATGLDWVFFIKQPLHQVPFAELVAIITPLIPAQQTPNTAA